MAQQSFKSPDEAAAALAAAVKSGAKQDMLKVLGADGEDIVSSGDDVADADARNKFTSAYDAKHSLKVDGKKASLIVGPDDFPFPIPLVHNKTGWEFDTDEGRQEILLPPHRAQRARHHPDLSRLCRCRERICRQGSRRRRRRLCAADRLHVPASRTACIGRRTTTTARSANSPPKPSAEGYKAGGEPQPYHGYYYRILTGQGQSAPGGALSYVVKGKMIGGFALVA